MNTLYTNPLLFCLLLLCHFLDQRAGKEESDLDKEAALLSSLYRSSTIASSLMSQAVSFLGSCCIVDGYTAGSFSCNNYPVVDRNNIIYVL
jgi:hypothetical protein